MPVLGTNTAALNAAFTLNSTSGLSQRSIARLSSGNKLANPSDNAAGLSVSNQLEASTRRLRAATEGAQTLISFAQTADGFLKVIQEQLVRMTEIAARAQNGVFSASDRANYSAEFEVLSTSISNQVANAKFNGTAVFGSTGTISVAVSHDAANVFNLVKRNLDDAAGGSLNGLAALGITTVSGASAAIGALSTMIQNISNDRANVNADVTALNYYIQNIGNEQINTQTANSRIRDVEFAEESTVLARNNILTEAATAMLAQANTRQSSALGLLR
jgi:flagellin